MFGKDSEEMGKPVLVFILVALLDLKDGILNRKKGIHHIRIEMATALLRNYAVGFFNGKGLLVRPPGGQGVEYVCQGYNPAHRGRILRGCPCA